MKVNTRLVSLHPRNVFRISRAARREALNVFLRIERDGISGYGEASANAYYFETAADVAAKLKTLPAFLEAHPVDSPADIAAIWEESWPLLSPSRAAQCALDVALWDWLGKRENLTVTELALGQKPRPVVSFATIGISSPAELDHKIAELAGFPRIKIKSDESADLSTATRVRSALPGALLAIDANCAWSNVDFAKLSPDLPPLNLDFIEQPFPPDLDGQAPDLPIPVIADESCVTLEDIDRLPPHFAGYNIKLVKCGGLTPALQMARGARGRKTMVGCMLESSLLISAGAVVAQLTDYADLDGAWLLADDPIQSWSFKSGALTPSPHPGLGVRPLHPLQPLAFSL